MTGVEDSLSAVDRTSGNQEGIRVDAVPQEPNPIGPGQPVTAPPPPHAQIPMYPPVHAPAFPVPAAARPRRSLRELWSTTIWDRSQFGPGTPWGTGLLVATASMLTMAVATIAFAAQLARISVILSVILSVIVGVGVVLFCWQWRLILTVRWIIYGASIGVPLGWLGALSGIS